MQLTAPLTSPVTFSRTAKAIVVDAPEYRLDVALGRPLAVLSSADGGLWTDLSLVASVDTVGMPDEASGAFAIAAEQDGDDVVITASADSSVWSSRVVTVRCTPTEVRASVRVTALDASIAGGAGPAIADVSVFGGSAVLPNGASGTFRSGIRFGSVFVPTPTQPVQVVRPSSSQAQLGVVGDADPGRLHGIFSPPPLCFAFGRDEADGDHGATAMPTGDWLGASVVAPVERLTFTTMRYDALDGGFLLRLTYEGHTRVGADGWVSPEFVLRPADAPLSAIDDYRTDLAARGWADAPPAAPAAWWLDPIFCGWGAQCAYAVALSAAAGEKGDPLPENADGFVLPAGASFAPDLARQPLYDRWLRRLASRGVVPGTVVIDDRWQAEYGTNTVDTEKWPDLRGWIADRHADGQRVLLWFKAWDPSGLPAALTVRDAHGRPVSVDPSNPAYLAALRDQVTRMLSADGLDADGFKVDFTQRAPSGVSLTAETDGVWGIAALHAIIRTIHEAAKAVKPDALVVTHTVHPSFGHVSDMIRLNDVLEDDVHGRPVPVADQVRFRHDVAAAALPGHPIDTDQWPMPNREEWLSYARVQAGLGVPALYYVESIDNSGEAITDADLDEIATIWERYRKEQASA